MIIPATFVRSSCCHLDIELVQALNECSRPNVRECQLLQLCVACRVHALFFTNKICCEPLTEWVHFADLRGGQEDYMMYLCRIMHSLSQMLDELSTELRPLEAAPPSNHALRSPQLVDGIPYMLHDDRWV